MLLAVFGDAAVLPQVAAAHANAQQHLCRLSALAHLVVELGMSEEHYFAPLGDVPALSAKLHAMAPLAAAARERLVVLGVHAKRTSGRRASIGGAKA